MRAFNSTEDPSELQLSSSQTEALTRNTLLHARKNSNSPYDVAAVYSGTTLVGNALNPNPADIGGASSSPPGSGKFYGSSTGSAKSPKSALAEAWGRADPEPFEDFSAGGYIESSSAQDGGFSDLPKYDNPSNGRTADISE